MRRAPRASAGRGFDLDRARAMLCKEHSGVRGAEVGVEFKQVDAVEGLIHRISSVRKRALWCVRLEILTRRARRASARKPQVSRL
jgi:hypothetical protein